MADFQLFVKAKMIHAVKSTLLLQFLLQSLGNGLVSAFQPQLKLASFRSQTPFSESKNDEKKPFNPTIMTRYGKAWDGLDIEESDEMEWYLINCIAGLEMDLLEQCRHACRNFPKTDVDRFAVPTIREARSHGKRNVVEDLVLFPGYVFARIRLYEDVYEEISDLVNTRSWMGIQRRKGMKKLPTVPQPLTEEEIEAFRLREKKMEEDTQKTEEELLEQYKGVKVGDMIKILEGKHHGEDGIVKRLKGGKISVRLYTYGSQFDEWLRPDQLRPLSELEVMRGLTGQEMPIRQDQFDESIGRPSQRRDKRFDDYGDENQFSKRNMRQSLMGNVKGMRGPRNRREDRASRGETMGRGRYGERDEQLRREDENWKKYQKKQADREMYDQRAKRENKNLYDEDSQWGRPSRRQSREESALTNDQDWSEFTSFGPDGDSDAGRQESEDPLLSQKSNEDDDFFNDLMSDLSATLDQDYNDQDQRNNKKGESNQGSKPQKEEKEDDFFSSLMSDLSESLDEAPTDPEPAQTNMRRSEPAQEEDDFFSALEKDLDQKQSPFERETSDTTDDDFFSQLEQELSSLESAEENTPAFESEDDFFSSLEQELELASNQKKEEIKVTNDVDVTFEAPSASSKGDLSKLKVGDLKQMLKEKGLKISGTKSELIERLNSSSSIPVSSSSASSSESGGEDLGQLSVAMLKGMLKEKGLKVSGKKSELIERLQSAS